MDPLGQIHQWSALGVGTGRYAIDIGAKEFFECMQTYEQIAALYKAHPDDGYDQQKAQAPNIAAMSKEDFDKLRAELTPLRREILDRIVDGRCPQIKDFVNDETLLSESGERIPEGTIRGYVSTVCRKFGVKGRKELATKVKSLLDPKAKT